MTRGENKGRNKRQKKKRTGCRVKRRWRGVGGGTQKPSMAEKNPMFS